MTVKDTVKDTADRAQTFASDTIATAGDKLHDAKVKLGESAEAAKAGASDTLAAAKDKVAGAYEVAREKSGAAIDAAKDKSGAAYEGVRDYAALAAEAARDKANAAYSSARETASTVRTKTATGIDESPLVALVGGIAAGVLIGALLPRTQKEVETLGPLGDKLSDIARAAIAAAKEAGQDTLDELGVNKDAARQQVDHLLDSASKAASSAGSAAVDAVRSPSSGQS